MSRTWKYSSIQSGLKVRRDRRDLPVRLAPLVLEDPLARLGHKVQLARLDQPARPVRRDQLVPLVPQGLLDRPVQKDSTGRPLGAVQPRTSSTMRCHFLVMHTSRCKRT